MAVLLQIVVADLALVILAICGVIGGIFTNIFSSWLFLIISALIWLQKRLYEKKCQPDCCPFYPLVSVTLTIIMVLLVSLVVIVAQLAPTEYLLICLSILIIIGLEAVKLQALRFAIYKKQMIY